MQQKKAEGVHPVIIGSVGDIIAIALARQVDTEDLQEDYHRPNCPIDRTLWRRRGVGYVRLG